MKLNTILTYEEACREFGDEYKASGKSRNLQLARWNRLAVVNKVGRGKYIIEKELKEEEKVNKNKVRDKLLDLCEKRHIVLMEEDIDSLKSDDYIHYVCKFHPDVVQKSKYYNLINSIGCPLCAYPMGRFEVMLHLGLPNSIHRTKIDGVEYDICLPDKRILIEVDGQMYHQHDKETGREDKKYAVAQKYGYRLIKIIEVSTVQEMRIEGDKIFIAVYGNANKQIKSQIISLIQSVLPYKHSDDLWDKAADYMRDWKYKQHQNNLESQQSIKQYDSNGILVHEYKSFSEIKTAIIAGEAFGFKWKVE